jgi:hypothetical protein
MVLETVETGFGIVAERKENCRKDVEWSFGVLQARFSMFGIMLFFGLTTNSER